MPLLATHLTRDTSRVLHCVPHAGERYAVRYPTIVPRLKLVAPLFIENCFAACLLNFRLLEVTRQKVIAYL